jgi:Asp-tRNA(Asn)/Glu-tRNA(Gln) amidotransferase A subunit family amidase
MVPVAIGTQTGGSVIRPASFCGVVGFKPTHGLLSTAGVLTYAASLDTLGFFTHTPEGMLRLWEALGHPTGRNEEHAFAVPDPIPEVDPDMRTAFIAAIARLRAGGVNIAPTGISARLIHLTVLQRTVADYEGTREHRQRVEKYGERLGEPANLVRRGTEISESRYREALESVNRERAWFDEQFRRTPVILTPAAPGPAPRTLASTGDHRMNSPWTLLGTPAATIPMGETGGLPLGLQLTAARGGDAVVLHAASRLATVLRS